MPFSDHLRHSEGTFMYYRHKTHYLRAKEPRPAVPLMPSSLTQSGRQAVQRDEHTAHASNPHTFPFVENG